ncbi:MAG: hypothetical protein J6T74_03540 [Clostridia bacterium]|nr:hypothetical protein [Clostridia bacterium]
MELSIIEIKTKCDFVGCKNLAKVAFIYPLDKKKKMNFCEECIKEIYECYAKTITPKALQTPFKNKKGYK